MKKKKKLNAKQWTFWGVSSSLIRVRIEKRKKELHLKDRQWVQEERIKEMSWASSLKMESIISSTWKLKEKKTNWNWNLNGDGNAKREFVMERMRRRKIIYTPLDFSTQPKKRKKKVSYASLISQNEI